MLEKENKVVFTFRIPEELYEWSKKEAEKMGVTQNAFLLMLIDDGKRLRKAKISVEIPQ